MNLYYCLMKHSISVNHVDHRHNSIWHLIFHVVHAPGPGVIANDNNDVENDDVVWMFYLRFTIVASGPNVKINILT